MSIQSWYARVFNAQSGTKARSKDVREEFDLVVAAFNKIQGLLKIADTQAPSEQTLDYSVAQRASMLLCFNSSGNVDIIQGAFTYRGDWLTATAYKLNDIVRDPSAPNSVYVVTTPHTSGVLATDIAANKLAVIIDMTAVATQVTAAAASASAASGSASAASSSAAAAAASAASAAASPGTSATSTDSLTIGLGVVSGTMTTGKSFAPGQTIAFADTAAPSTNAMYGPLISYNSGTGAFSFTSLQTLGSGTKSAWTISVSGPAVTESALVQAFGDGADGDVTISAGTTTLTRTMRYNNLTINGTGSLDPAGYQIYVKGVLDLTSAPANAILRTPVAGGAGTGDTTAIAEFEAGGSGVGKGGRSGGAGAGTAGQQAVKTGKMQGGLGGAGGAGGLGASGAGGAGGAAPAAVTTVKNPSFGPNILASFGVLAQGGVGGSSGGAGGGDGGNAGDSGQGGPGGGVIDIRARTIARSASTAAGAISAKGSAGASGTAPSTGNRGGGGGSGGGGGGFVSILCGMLTGATATNCIDVSGGLGGNGGAKTGTGVLGTGGNGGQGGTTHIGVLAAGTNVYNAIGTAGSAASGVTGGAGGVARADL